MSLPGIRRQFNAKWHDWSREIFIRRHIWLRQVHPYASMRWIHEKAKASGEVR